VSSCPTRGNVSKPCTLLTIGLTLLATNAKSQDLPPYVISIGANCNAIKHIALAWLKSRGAHSDTRYDCLDKSTCSFALTASKIRSVHRLPILGFVGRYVVRGRWYSLLTAPHATGSEGELVLTKNGPNACVLSLSFTFHSQIADSVCWWSSNSAGDERYGSNPSCTPVFAPRTGPDLKSNRRLEGEYVRAIVAAVRRKHP